MVAVVRCASSEAGRTAKTKINKKTAIVRMRFIKPPGIGAVYQNSMPKFARNRFNNLPVVNYTPVPGRPPKPPELRGTVIQRIIGEALMKAFSSYSLLCLSIMSVTVLSGSQTLDEARRLENSGDAIR